MSTAAAWGVSDAGPVVDPDDAPADAAADGVDDTGQTSDRWTRMRTQQLAEQDHQPQQHRVADLLLGNGRRTLVTLPWVSPSPSMPWWQRPGPYWETALFDAQRKWRRWASGSGEFTGSETPYPVTDLGAASEPPTIPLTEVPVETYGDLVGLLRLAGVLSSEQVEAFTGDRKARSKLRRLSRAGITECAWFHAPGAGFPRVEMWRLRRGERWAAYVRAIRSARLDARVFCGLPPWGALPGVLHTRHQSLAAELVLCTLEAGGPWAGWLAEAVCVPDRFLPLGHPHLPQERAAAETMRRVGRDARFAVLAGVSSTAGIDHVSVRADAALVRADGVKVFVELQAQPSYDSVLRKVANWSRLITAGGIGGLVLFVAAPKPTQMLASTVNEIKQVIEGHAAPEAWPSLLVGSWQDYSPDHKELTADCGTLRAVRWDGREWTETAAATTPVEPYLPDWSLLGRLGDLCTSVPWLQ